MQHECKFEAGTCAKISGVSEKIPKQTTDAHPRYFESG